MGDKPFPGFPWFSYPEPKFVGKNKMYNELYLRIEKLEERVAELEEAVAAFAQATERAMTAVTKRLLNDTEDI